MNTKYPQLGKILRRLLFEKNMKVADLDRNIDMHIPTVHRIVTGKSVKPYKSSLEAMAAYFKVSITQLIGDEPLYLDAMPNSNLKVINENIRNVPLINWQSLNNETYIETDEFMLLVAHVSEKSFALVMPDHSMEPLFQKNSTLIFDPAFSITDHDYVLVRLHAFDNYIFRQLLIDGEQKFIKSINPDISPTSLRALESEDKIIARLVETRNRYD